MQSLEIEIQDLGKSCAMQGFLMQSLGIEIEGSGKPCAMQGFLMQSLEIDIGSAAVSPSPAVPSCAQPRVTIDGGRRRRPFVLNVAEHRGAGGGRGRRDLRLFFKCFGKALKKRSAVFFLSASGHGSGRGDLLF